MSPCVTISRRRFARYSPGTSCHAGSPLCAPKLTCAAGLGRREEDAPAVVGHLHVVEVRPALGLDADRGAQVDVRRGRALGAHVAPPVEELGLPVLERALQRPVAREVDVVRDLFAVVDAHRAFLVRCRVGRARQTRSQLKRGLLPVPKTFSAPASPTAFGRMKIQFCQAESRPKIARLHRLGAAEAQVRLHAGQRVGRQARALLERDADLVVPVEVVGRDGDEAELERRVRGRARGRRRPSRARSAPPSP